MKSEFCMINLLSIWAGIHIFGYNGSLLPGVVCLVRDCMLLIEVAVWNLSWFASIASELSIKLFPKPTFWINCLSSSNIYDPPASKYLNHSLIYWLSWHQLYWYNSSLLPGLVCLLRDGMLFEVASEISLDLQNLPSPVGFDGDSTLLIKVGSLSFY